MTSDLDAAREQIAALFECDGKESIEVSRSVHNGKPCLLVTAAQMYNKPTYKGGGGLYGLLNGLCQATGCNSVDDYSDIRREGCETCDYGSLYGTVWVLWEEA